MPTTIEMPDEIMDTVKFPPDRAKDELVKEMAFSLYQRKVLSMGNARKLSGLDKWAFIGGLAERKIERHYSEQDLLDDIEYAN
jgi:predicted HTH domain antitoxin